MQPTAAKAARPHTGAVIVEGRAGVANKSSMKKFIPFAGRAVSAGLPQGQGGSRSEAMINRFRKRLEDERKLQRTMKTMLAQEIESKNVLEKLLRQCVDDVKGEIARKRSANTSNFIAQGKKGRK